MSDRRAGPRMDILFVGPLIPLPGGAAISMAQLLIGLAERGHAVRAIAPITAETLSTGQTFFARSKVDVAWFELPWFEIATGIPPPDSYRQLEADRLHAAFAAAIGRGRPDIILIGRESFAWHVPPLARRGGVPCVLLARGHPSRNIFDGAYEATAAAHYLEQFRRVDQIVVPARHLVEGFERFGLGPVELVPNAIDVRQFAPRPKDPTLVRSLGLRESDVVVVHASNLTPLKRPLDVVESAAAALARHPGLHYVVVGDGPLRADLEAACRRLQIEARIHFVGWIEYQRVPDYINLADLVVMTSAIEGLSRVYLETQACGRTLLASDIPAAREVVEPGRTGLLFRVGDVPDLTAKTLLAASDPELRAVLGGRARESVERRDLSAEVTAYADILGRVVQRRRPPVPDRATRARGSPS